MIKSIELENWRQFEKIKIDFHDRLTILTGANGTGKTTILDIINQHFASKIRLRLISTAIQDDKTGALRYTSDSDTRTISQNEHKITSAQHKIGKVIYLNNKETNILISNSVRRLYIISGNLLQINGFNISSHREPFQYRAILSLPTQLITAQTAYKKYRKAQINRDEAKHHKEKNTATYQNEVPSTYHIKEALISLAIFGYGNAVVAPNKDAIQVYEGFIEILQTVLPKKLGFQTLSIRTPEVVLITDSGEFNLDAVSGGIASIIELAWMIYMYDIYINDTFLVSFDEPENHLHPEMQKTLLPNFLEAFPNLKFVVATHSPFIISSVSDSNVYALTYNENRKVESHVLDEFDRTGTANEILRQALGLESTTADWVNEKLDAILNQYADQGITPENIQAFKNELNNAGFGKYVNQSVVELISRNAS